MEPKIKEVEIDEEKWDCYEKYEDDYAELGELPHKLAIKKPVDKSGRGELDND